MPALDQLFVQARSLFSFVMIELLLKKFLTDANGYAILFKVILTTLPKTAGAERHKVNTPAEGTDIVVYFYPPVLRVTEGFYFTENVYQAVIEIKQEVNQSWQKLN